MLLVRTDAAEIDTKYRAAMRLMIMSKPEASAVAFWAMLRVSTFAPSMRFLPSTLMKATAGFGTFANS